MEAVCTMCSREKDPGKNYMQARKRYLGEHISKVREIAQGKGREFFIFSGKHGLLHENDMILGYEYLLEREEDIERLAKKAAAQLAKHRIGKLWIYSKSKPQWEPYRRALIRACALKRVVFEDVRISDEDEPLSDPKTVLHLVR